MRRPSTAELLDVWEAGLGLPAPRRALALLAAAHPEMPPDALARLSIGERDARLAALRAATFGLRVTGLAACPACGERVEPSFDTADALGSAAGLLASRPNEGHSLEVEGYTVRFRLPDSTDLLAVEGQGDPETAAAALMERCLLSVRHEGEERPAGRLPERVLDAVAAAMAELDPQAALELALDCPACGHHWLTGFDILSFFWRELDAWAYRLLREVHALASAYGWREADILALSPARRQFYLDMIG